MANSSLQPKPYPRDRISRPSRPPGAAGARSRLPLLDRGTYERPVLGPGTVVVLDVPVAQELGEDEPGVGGALPDAAVRDDLPVRGDPGTTVEGLQLVCRLEGAVVVRRLAPGDVGGARDVPGDLGLLLRQMVGGQLLPPEFLGRANVDECRLTFPDPVEHVVAVGPEVVHHRPLDAVVG